MFKVNKKDLNGLILKKCNWFQACQWLEDALVPLPEAFEYLDPKRDHIQHNELTRHFSENPIFWRRSQVLAAAIKARVLPEPESKKYEDAIKNINNITNDPRITLDYIKQELPKFIRDLSNDDLTFDFHDLEEAFPNGIYKMNLYTNHIFFDDFLVFIQNDLLMLSVNEKTAQQIYDLRTSSPTTDILRYLVSKRPNTPVSYDELKYNIYSLRSESSTLNENNLHSIRDKVIQTIQTRKIKHTVKQSDLKLLKTLFVCKDKKLIFYTKPAQE